MEQAVHRLDGRVIGQVALDVRHQGHRPVLADQFVIGRDGTDLGQSLIDDWSDGTLQVGRRDALEVLCGGIDRTVVNGLAYESFAVLMSSRGDGVLSPMTDLSTLPALESAVMSAFRLPGHVVLGPTYTDGNDHRMVLIATATEFRGIKGVMVAVLDITEFFNVFASDQLPAGLAVRMIERDTEARGQEAFIPVIGDRRPGADVVATEVLRLVSGQARWDLNWDVTSDYLEGPSDFSGMLVQIGGSLLSILLFGSMGFLVFQNIRFHTQVAERTAALSQNSMIVQLTMDSIDQGFAVWNADQRLVVWSRRCYDFRLEPPKDVLRVGMHIRELLEHLARAGAFGSDADGTVVEQELERITIAGAASQDIFTTPNNRHMHVRRFPLEHGGYVAVYTDITEQEETTRTLSRANEELQIEKRKAESASRAKTDFLANMSHELRTPLNSIIGFSELIAKHSTDDLPEKYRHYADLIHRSGRHLHDVIGNILDLSKIESDALELDEKFFPIDDALGDVESLLTDMAGSNDVSLKHVPCDDPFLSLWADPVRFKQVIINLVNNAIKFSAGGTVTIETLVTHDIIKIRIADTGQGIPADDLPTITDAFVQTRKSSEQSHDGTGLGLAIAKRIVELHDGTMTIESEVGVGTTVTLGFPIARTLDGYANTTPVGD